MSARSPSRAVPPGASASRGTGFTPGISWSMGKKMSKSAGTFFTIRDLLQRGASPAAIRLELVRTHYRVNANFTFQGLKDAQRQVGRWKRLAGWLEANADGTRPSPGPLESALPRFLEAVGNDLNMAGAIGVLNEAAGEVPVEAPATGDGDGCWSSDLDALRSMDHVLGVLTGTGYGSGDGLQ